MNTSIVLLVVFVVGYLTLAHLWNKYSKTSKKDRYLRGYNYGASTLLKKEETCDSLLYKTHNPDSNEFDDGVRQAIRDYALLTKDGHE